MQKITIMALCLAMFAASVAHAATNRVVPTAYTTIQAAVNAADAGDTITITDSGTYTGGLKITKALNVVAASGQTPMIQSESGTTTPTLLFDTNSGGTKFGSLTGGRIRVNFVKPAANTATVPTGMVKFGQSTDTLVVMENVLIDESGTAAGYGATAVCHDINCHNIVNMRYVDINTSHSTAGGATTAGIIIGNGPALASGYPSNLYNSMGGPTYTLEHVSVKYYCVAGIMQCMTSTTLNMSYCDVGVLGDSGRNADHTGRPWGSYNQSGVPNASTTGRMDHCVWRGSRCGNNFQIDSPGTSITLSRCAFINNVYGGTSGCAGITVVGKSTKYAGRNYTSYVNADHCDFVGLSTASSIPGFINSTTKNLYAAAVYVTTQSTVTHTPIINISNSNVYADFNNTFIFAKSTPSFTLTTDHTNVYTGGSQASLNYTPGTGDKSVDPMYMNASIVDLRYFNNTLKTADSEGGPIGVYGDYSDITNGIPVHNEVNRAHNWSMLK